MDSLSISPGETVVILVAAVVLVIVGIVRAIRERKL
jgi:hypothetical protein